MKNYLIKKVENKKTPYSYIVFAMSYISPLDYMKEIEVELSEKGFVGRVFFDLSVCDGWGLGRYLEGLFNGETFVKFETAYPPYPACVHTIKAFNRKDKDKG